MPDLGERYPASASRVTASRASGTAVFHLQGDLDGASAAAMRLSLRAALGESTVLFDLTEVSFLDRIGVGILLGAIRGIHESGGVIAIGGADSRRGIAAALRTAGVDRLVFLGDSAAQAMEWLRETEDRPARSSREG